ncbi:MAG: molybdate ABC transporter permease subunit [Spirochaetia bacterium]|nr:molybdate ABC transporter permease subunit [Spirochaetia bacterium]
MTTYDLEPLFLTFKLSFITSVILIFLGLPMAYWLAFSKKKYKIAIEALVSMPIVLPPSVLGFYLLAAFSPAGAFGGFLDDVFNLKLVFTFEGLIVASVIYSFPFMVQPIQAGFQNLPISLREASFTLGKSAMTTLFKALVPNIKPSLLAGFILSFAHTIGEFGVVLMIGGSMKGETKVASIAIYEEVEALNYGAANFYSAILFFAAFVILILVYAANKKWVKPLN